MSMALAILSFTSAWSSSEGTRSNSRFHPWNHAPTAPKLAPWHNQEVSA